MNTINYFRNQDRLFALVLIGLAAIMFAITGSMEEPRAPGALAASTYPKLVLGCIIIISCILILRPGSDIGEKAHISLKGLPVIILTALYISLIEKTGFFVLTPVFLFALPLLAGYRNYVTIIVSVLVVTASLYGVFVEVLSIPLPTGVFGD